MRSEKLEIKKIMKKYFSSLISHISSHKGFTLIELMVVLTVTAVLGTLGIAGFTTYNQIQVLQSSASEVATMLNLAKSRAQSQVKLSTLCGSSGVLDGYKVNIVAPKSYSLYLRCTIAGSTADRLVAEEAKVLSGDISFSSDTSFFFPIQTGGVQVAGQIVIMGFGRDKTITVNSLGGINTR